MINFGPVETNLLVGNAPHGRVDVARLKQMQVSAVLSLQSDSDFKTHQIDHKTLLSAYQDNDILIYRIAIIDFDEKDLGDNVAQAAKRLNQLLTTGHRVYVHCNAGVCRAPATVLTYLCFYRHMSIEDGLEYIRRVRPQAHPYISAVKKGLEELRKQADTENNDAHPSV